MFTYKAPEDHSEIYQETFLSPPKINFGLSYNQQLPTPKVYKTFPTFTGKQETQPSIISTGTLGAIDRTASFRSSEISQDNLICRDDSMISSQTLAELNRPQWTLVEAERQKQCEGLFQGPVSSTTLELVND